MSISDDDLNKVISGKWSITGPDYLSNLGENIPWPKDIGTGTITGRQLVFMADTGDENRDPDIYRAPVRVKIYPDVEYVTYSGEGGETDFYAVTYDAVLDKDGYLCTRNRDGSAGERGIVLPATNSSKISPRNFTYTVEIQIAGKKRFFTTDLPEGSVRDLSAISRVFPSKGTAVVVDTDTAQRAEDAAKRAEAVASIDWTGKTGDKGLSAYEVAVKEGFEGTEAQWLASLRARDGGFTVFETGPGTAAITGVAVQQKSVGVVSVLSNVIAMDSWSVNPLAQEQDRPITYLSHDPETNALYSGYGDWNANGDYIGLVRHDIDTGAATVVHAPIPTEAIGPVLRLSSGLYVPFVDPVGYWDPSGGYASDETGKWETHMLPQQPEHVFDMVENSQGLWACGSHITQDQTTSAQALWHRPNGGEWELVQEGTRGDWDRWYHLTVENDAVVPHATEENYSSVSKIRVGEYLYTGMNGGKINRTEVN